MFVRVVLKHRTLSKIVVAAVIGVLIATLVWIADFVVNVPAVYGFTGNLYESHRVARVLLLPGSIALLALIEQRVLWLVFFGIVLNSSYWGSWLVYRFLFECGGQIPARYPGVIAFLQDYGLNDLVPQLELGVIVALVACFLAMKTRPRVPQDGTLCPSCGYSLQGLGSSLCPECGHSASPEELLPPV